LGTDEAILRKMVMKYSWLFFGYCLFAVLIAVLLATTWGMAQMAQVERSESIAAAGEEATQKTQGLQVGAKAPDFTLQDSAGQKRSLADFGGKKQVALVFYPALFRTGG
jgi:cytochrome oxidase Cu insertion factor (SCO1/SenC/PrrC family)